MGKMLLGSFALSLGIAGFVGGGSDSSPAVNPAGILQQEKAMELQRANYLHQVDDAANSDASQAAANQQTAAKSEN